MTSWLAVCQEAAAGVERVLAKLPTRAEREPRVGDGEGGDETTAVDAAAEEAVVRALEAHHETGVDFTLVSEELGVRRFGERPRWWVVVDPIDGSVNAKRGIPFFSLSIAVAAGPTMADVTFGYVRDFGTGEEWTAVRGGGAFLNGESIRALRPKDTIELLSFEATLTHYVAERSAAFLELAPRLRIMGSLALSLCHLAAGRVDAVVSLRPVRSVDIAAGQLLVCEQGLCIELPSLESFGGAPLDVGSHSRVVAAATAADCARLAAALEG